MSPGRIASPADSSQQTPDQQHYVCCQCRTHIGQRANFIGRMPGNESLSFFNHDLMNLFIADEPLVQIDVFTLARASCVNCRHELGRKIVLDSRPLEPMFSSTNKFIMDLNTLLSWDGITFRYANTNLAYRYVENVYRFMCRVCKRPIARGHDIIMRRHPLALGPGYSAFENNLINVEVDHESRHQIGAYSANSVNCICGSSLGRKIICDRQPQGTPMLFTSDVFVLTLNTLLWWDGTRNDDINPHISSGF